VNLGNKSAVKAVVLGGSAGSVSLVLDLVNALPADFPLPLIVCFHLHPNDGGQMAAHLGDRGPVKVLEACDKMPIEPNRVYVAPSGYHLLIERAHTFALSTDPKVHYCRPAIDVLFESAALAYGPGLLGVLLSGANQDGAAGLGQIRLKGGQTVVQDPRTATSPEMPQAAIAAGVAQLVLTPRELCLLVASLGQDRDLKKGAAS
jgi:two-component system chemotaxis response regulator CheB